MNASTSENKDPASGGAATTSAEAAGKRETAASPPAATRSAAEGEEESTSSSYEYDYEESEEEEEDDGTSQDAPEEEQENLLSFAALTIPRELEGHRFMTVQAFRTRMLIGTNQGTVAVLRLPPAQSDARPPNSTASSPSQRQPTLLHVWQNHTDPISDVSCNEAESFVAASDKTGSVSVQNLEDKQDVWRRQMEVPVLSVAMHPTYELQDDRPIVCAGADKVFMVAKLLFLSHRRSTLLAEKNGRVACVRWAPSGEFIAWLTERGLSLYSHRDKTILRTVPSPILSTVPVSSTAATTATPLQQQHQHHQREARKLELYPPTLFWERFPSNSSSSRDNQNTLLCGWGDWVQQIRIREVAAKPDSLGIGMDSRVYRVEGFTQKAMRPSTMESPYRVCGIAPFGTERYLVLACVVDGNAVEGAMRDLEVRVVSRFTLEDLYRGRMLVDYAHPLQLALTCHYGTHEPKDLGAPAATPSAPPPTPPRSALYPPPDTVYYILSVDTLVQATPCDEDDHVDYLLRTRRFEEAYQYALRHRLHRHNVAHLAQQMLTALLERNEVDRVVALLPECVGAGDCAEWERWIFVFDQRGESWRLVDALPTRQGRQQLQRAASSDARPGDSGGATAVVASPLPARQPLAHLARGTVMPTALFVGKEYYDLVLLRALEHDPALFNVAVHRFEGLFSVDVVTKAAEMKYHEYSGLVLPMAEAAVIGAPGRATVAAAAAVGADSRTDAERDRGTAADNGPPLTLEEQRLKALSEAYGGLLRLQGRNEEALQVLLRVKDSDELFHFIRQTSLFQKALDLLPELFVRSESRTVALLLEHASSPQSASAGSPTSGAPQPLTTQSQPPGAITRSGPAKDPLAPEAVVRRLEHSDRKLLWYYLDALHKHNKAAFTAVAKRNAQLMATLFIDYDRAQLLPFLKEMSMYLDRIKEVYALCRKHDLLDEVVFLMARMGREEEGLKVLVQQARNMHKAVRYITEIPNREDQAPLFRKLVQLAIEVNSQLPVSSGVDGYRYVLHDTQIGDTYASLAARYGVDEERIREANQDPGRPGGNTGYGSTSMGGASPPGTPGSRGSSSFGFSAPSSATKAGRRNMLRHYTAPVSPLLPNLSNGGSGTNINHRQLRQGSSRNLEQLAGRSSRSSSSERDPGPSPQRPPPRPCVVPLNVLSALLAAAADPTYADSPAIDATYLIKSLPDSEAIPHVGAYIAAVTRSRADEEAFLGTILQTTERDLSEDYGGLLRRRAAAIRIDPTAKTLNVNSSRKLSLSGAAEAGGRRGVSPRHLHTQGTPSAVATTAVTGPGCGDSMACGLCGQRVPLSAAKTAVSASAKPEEEEELGGLVVFACHHVYHPRCVLSFLAAEGGLADSVNVSTVSLTAFFENPMRFVGPKASNTDDRVNFYYGGGKGGGAGSRKRGTPHCRVCAMGGGSGSGAEGAPRLK